MLIAEFEIHGLPKTRNQMSYNWRACHAEAKKWKNHVIGQCEFLGITGLKLTNAKLTFIRCSSKELDWDNLITSFKHVLDGLTEAGVILDDKPSVIGQPQFFWERCPPKQGKIKIRIERA